LRERLKQLRNVLLLDFHKVKLSWLLASINVALVLLVVGGISWSAVRLLRDLADNQGLVRVQYAGATAREELRKYGEDLLTATRGMADRSTLRRVAVEDTAQALVPVLRRACETANADICALWNDGTLLAQAGGALAGAPAWKDVLAAAAEQGERFMVAPAQTAKPAMGASATLAGATGKLQIFALRYLDEKLAARLSERTGMNVRLVNFRSYSQQPRDDFTRLHSDALSDGRSAAARIDDLQLFASSVPVFAGTGETVALIETRLPSQELDASVHALVRRLTIAAVVLGALALGAAIFLGRQVAGPVRALTDAATRLGQGDFSTSIPTAGAAEVGVLARTMEDMRRNLVDLTNTLRRSEAEAQAVLNGVVEGVFAVDKQRAITYLNPQAARLLGVDAEQVKGKFCGDVLKPRAEQGRPCERDCPILHARERGSARATEYLDCTTGQPRTTVITSAAPVDGLQVQVIRDETDLEAARRARDSVLANISHEFRTPLAAQLASIELLRDGLTQLPGSQQRELVMSLERGTHRLTRLIDNLLESVRIESGQLAIRRQSVALADVVEDARELLGSLFELRKQNLRIELDGLPAIEGDAPRLTQVFVNLLANANKYAPEGSTVHVGGQTQNGNLVVWVEDEGGGVPDTAQGAIFHRFARGPADEPDPGGLGLGLWIVRSIVERHGGTVGTERTAQQRTRFKIVLPGAP
jgi:signal transduction histidine kinase